MGDTGSRAPVLLLGFSSCSQLGLMACCRRRLCQWDMTERFCKHWVRTCSKPKYGWIPVTHVAVQWHWVSLDLPGGIELSPQRCWRIKTSKQKKMDEPARIMAWPLEECGLNLYHFFHIHSPFWMSYSFFYCSGGKAIFWEKKMLLWVHFWPPQGVKCSRFLVAGAAGISVSLVGWNLYSALTQVQTATDGQLCCSMFKLVWISDPREALNSTMQIKACSRSSQHLPVAALPEHMDRVVVFLSRGILSSAPLSSAAILPTQHLPLLWSFLFTVLFNEYPQDQLCWASWARISWTGHMRFLSFSREVTAWECWVPRRTTSNIFSPSGLSVAATAWVLRLWGRVLIYWIH